MKPKYRVLISTRGLMSLRHNPYENESYHKWRDNYIESNHSKKYLEENRTIQANQVNYFIPISE